MISSSTAASPAAAAPTAPALSFQAATQTGLPAYGPALRDDLLTSFHGPVTKATLPFTYRLALVGVAFVMILLPFVYLGLVVAAGYGVYYYFTHVPVPAGGGRRTALVFWALYISPLFIGPLLIVFMVKPLFAPPARPHVLHALSRQKEPLLFAFIERLCEALGAPVPRRIDVDCEVNASAGYRRGLLSLFGSDLVLTIGLPLASGLSLAQLTGVLAHEFGHFSQGAGMRLSYLVRRINMWFQRVVHERDGLDEWLDHSASEAENLVIILVLQACRLVVWLTRRLLWFLSFVAHVVSCFLMRQMEFDADTYEARLVGSRIFESTVNELMALGISHQQSLGSLSESLQESRLADNLPALTQTRRRGLSKETLDAIAGHIREEETGIFDTHPADKDRIANARQQGGSPVFRSDLPATVLFRDFDGLSRTVSRAFYRAVLGDALNEQSLVETNVIAEKQEKSIHEQEALGRYVGAAANSWRPIALRQLAQPPADASTAYATLTAARAEVAKAQAEHLRRLERYQQAMRQHVEALQASGLVRAGFTIEPEEFSLPRADPATVERALARAEQRCQATVQPLAQIEYVFPVRLMSALHLLRFPEMHRRLDGAAELFQEAQGFYQHVVVFERVFPAMVEIEKQCAVMQILVRNLSQVEGADATPLEECTRQVKKLLSGVKHQLIGPSYPFEHPDGPTTLERVIVPTEPDLDIEMLYRMSGAAVSSFFEVYFKVWSRLAAIGEAVEGALGLEPIPRPEE